MSVVFNTQLDITQWAQVNGVIGGFVYFFLVSISGVQYLCPIYVGGTSGIICRHYIDGSIYLSIESQSGYVNAKLSSSTGVLVRVYKAK